MAAKFAEKLTILQEVGDGLLARLQLAIINLRPGSPQRPAFLDDPKLKKILAQFGKDFPAISPTAAQIPGYSDLMSQANLICENLEFAYYTLVDVDEFRTTAWTLLTEIASSVAALQWDFNPKLTSGFLNLVTIYVKVFFMIKRIPSLTIVLPVFASSFQKSRSAPEDNYNKTTKMVRDFSDTSARFIHDFQPLSGKIKEALESVYFLYVQVQDISNLRSKGLHSLTLNPARMSQPSEEPELYALLDVEKIVSWITFGFMVSPAAFGSTTSVQMAKLVLRQGFFAGVHGFVALFPHPQFDKALSWKPKQKELAKKIAKEKRMTAEAFKFATHLSSTKQNVVSGPQLHSSRRVYLRQELSNLFHLLSDKPGLLGPKMTLVMSILAFAKDEVLWYYRHLDAPGIPKAALKYVKSGNWEDPHICDLMFFMNSVVALIRKHSNVIQTYYQKFMKGLDLNLCREQLSKLGASGDVSRLLESILSDAANISVGSPSDFKALRLNWFRAESLLSTNASILTMKSLLQSFNTLINHSRYVDSIEELIDQYASLKELYYFQTTFMKSFEEILKSSGATQPSHIMVYLQIIAEFQANATKWTPAEKQRIGEQAVVLAETCLEKIAGAINKFLFDGAQSISTWFLSFDSQLRPVNAAYMMLQKSGVSGFKPKTMPQIPGTESKWSTRGKLENLKLLERHCFQLCAALNGVVDLTVYNTRFTPREYLRERLVVSLKNKMVTAASGTVEGLIARPTEIERKINVYAAVMKMVENYVDLDVGSILREVFVQQVYNPSVGESGNLESFTTTGPAKEERNLLQRVVGFYSNFVTSRLSPFDSKGNLDEQEIVYSPARQSFISRTGKIEGPRAEQYCDLTELCALARLIGPYGVKLLDRSLLQFVSGCLAKAVRYLGRNKALVEKAGALLDTEAVFEVVKKELKGLDTGFVGHFIHMGSALQFRELLYMALGRVSKASIPYIYNTIAVTFKQYPANTFMDPKFLATDCLAREVGVETGSSDPFIRHFLRDVISKVKDKTLWTALPTLMSLSFLSAPFLEADYRTAIEAHTNNVHTLVSTYHTILVVIKSLDGTTSSETDIANYLKTFIRGTASLFLQILQIDKRDRSRLLLKAPASLPSTVIVMDKFVDFSPYITRDFLESIMPYTLLRSMYKELYETKKSKKGVPDDAF